MSGAVVASLLAATLVPLPFLDDDLIRSVGSADQPLTAHDLGHLFQSGVRPALQAFLAVEVVALLVPGLRGWRRSQRGRRRLLGWTATLAALFGLIQGLAVVKGLQEMTFFGTPVLREGWVYSTTYVLTCAVSTLLPFVVAPLLRRWGLGSAWAVLWLTACWPQVQEVMALPTLPLETAVQGLGVAAITVVVTHTVLRSPPIPLPGGARLLHPGGGIVPALIGLYGAAGAGLVVVSLGVVGIEWSGAPSVDEYFIEGWGGVAAAVLTLATAVPLTRWLTPARGVAEVARGARDGGSAEDAVGSLARARGRALRFAILGPAVLLGLHVFAHWAESWFLPLVIAPGWAIALDLRAEWRALAGGPLVTVWTEHRDYAIDAGLASLEEAGIRAHARGRSYRALMRGFAPWAPVEVQVAPDDAASAHAILSERLEPDGAEPLLGALERVGA